MADSIWRPKWKIWFAIKNLLSADLPKSAKFNEWINEFFVKKSANFDWSFAYNSLLMQDNYIFIYYSRIHTDFRNIKYQTRNTNQLQNT